MWSNRAAPARSSDEEEKPFWISYADLMTAMMVLFLVVMTASLSAVTQSIQRMEQGEKQRSSEIFDMCQNLKDKAGKINSSIYVNCFENRINFGEAGRFAHNRYDLNEEGQKALQEVIPLILDAAENEIGRKWFKQVVIEGFTDTDGSYLYNLHLSLQRSEWVMCTLLDWRSPVQKGLSQQRQEQIRRLFLTGGVSFNNAKESKAASRRVELRLQFFGLKEKDSKPVRELPFDKTTVERCRLR